MFDLFKKSVSLAVIFLFLLGSTIHADLLEKFTGPPRYTWGDKLKRGAVNIVSSPVEIARQIQITSSEQSLLAGWTIGLISGIGQGLLRCGAGAIDLVTFPFNFPNSRKGPLVKPEYVWQKPGPKYS